MDTGPEAVNGRAEFAAVALALVSGARRYVDLLTFDLDRDTYGSPSFVDAIKRLMLSSPMTRLRVLINQPRQAASRGHLLIELGRQLTSRIEFREIDSEQGRDHRGEWLIVDGRALLELGERGQLTARLWREAPELGRQRSERFEQLWEAAVPAQELRELRL